MTMLWRGDEHAEIDDLPRVGEYVRQDWTPYHNIH